MILWRNVKVFIARKHKAQNVSCARNRFDTLQRLVLKAFLRKLI